jgi:RNA polymerase sigma factor (TIGR02999 family)
MAELYQHVNMGPQSGKITGLLRAWGNGDQAAQQELIPLVYNELRELASRYRRKAGAGDTLQTTALVNEAYIRLVNIDGVDWRDRAHFFAIAANVIRRILIDVARAHTAEKRGGSDREMIVPDWNDIPLPALCGADELLALDETLHRLTEMDSRRGRIVELRVFGGLSVEETAEVLGVSAITVMRDWRVAKAWLVRELRGPAGA